MRIKQWEPDEKIKLFSKYGLMDKMSNHLVSKLNSVAFGERFEH